MKTRKQKTTVSKRASHRPTQRGAAPGRPAAARGTAATRTRAAAARSSAASAHEQSSLALAAECTVAAADSLKAELARRLDESGPVTLDVSALQRIDTAALQLLAAFIRDRRTAGRAVTWRGRAAALDSAAARLGLHDMLELPREVGR
ncbi:MAG TPA: STAS domain-containing protein [Steroidobacteraceae bacterium]|jgi:ABC-type transporter Mla MlaB component|nr:STAS domain-containing protein [Steroidobacteraceae bacterium]